MKERRCQGEIRAGSITGMAGAGIPRGNSGNVDLLGGEGGRLGTWTGGLFSYLGMSTFPVFRLTGLFNRTWLVLDAICLPVTGRPMEEATQPVRQDEEGEDQGGQFLRHF